MNAYELNIGNMCSDQLLASKIHNNFNLRKKNIEKNCRPFDFYLPT